MRDLPFPDGSRAGPAPRGPACPARVALAVALAGMVAGCTPPRDEPEVEEPASATTSEPEPEEVTFGGVEWRAAWVQSYEDPGDTWQSGFGARLVVRAGGDGGSGGERVLVSGPRNIARPTFTPDGGRVLFSSRQPGRPEGSPVFDLMEIPWEGGEPRRLGGGLVGDTWRDPGTGAVRVLAAEGVRERGSVLLARRLVVFPLDDPGARETVWDRTPVSLENVQVSGDGRFVGGCFPWPKGAVADLGTGDLVPTAHGCWAAVAPDASGVAWVFDGRHRNLRLVAEPGVSEPRPVRVNTAPGIDGFEVYHPRWSNHPRFFACTGPYREGEGGIRIGAGGTSVEVFIGHFDRSLSRVGAWERVTENEWADFAPDVWIAGPVESLDLEAVAGVPDPRERDTRAARAVDLAGAWPGNRDDLVFLWENRDALNEVAWPRGERRAFRFEPHGPARFGRHGDLRPAGGWFQLQEPAGEAIAAAVRESGAFALEMTLTPDIDDLEQSAVIFSLGNHSRERNLTLSQTGTSLELRVRTMGTRIDAAKTAESFGDLDGGGPVHVVASFRHGQLDLHVDGERHSVRRGLFEDGLGNWTPQQLVVGNEIGGGFPWFGSIEAIALYARPMSDEEAAEHFRLARERLAERTTTAPVTVRCRLLEAGPLPDLDSLGAYRRHLTAHIYECLDGALRGDRLVVYHWTVLDRSLVVGFPRTVGEEFELVLEPVDDHPELQSESMDLSDALDLAAFLDVGESERLE